jgi:hypothetical protein
MRLFSRELLVGLLLVLLVAAAGCQPVQPVSGVPAVPTTSGVATAGNVVESEAVSDTAVLSPTLAITSDVASTSPVSERSAITVGVPENGAQAPLNADPALLEAGLATYRAQYCGVCHTLDAAGTRGTFGPPHNGMGAVAAERLADGSYQGAATTPAEYIRESIVDPQVFIAPGYATTSHRMPSYAHLDAATLDALVAFLLAQ